MEPSQPASTANPLNKVLRDFVWRPVSFAQFQTVYQEIIHLLARVKRAEKRLNCTIKLEEVTPLLLGNSHPERVNLLLTSAEMLLEELNDEDLSPVAMEEMASIVRAP